MSTKRKRYWQVTNDLPTAKELLAGAEAAREQLDDGSTLDELSTRSYELEAAAYEALAEFVAHRDMVTDARMREAFS